MSGCDRQSASEAEERGIALERDTRPLPGESPGMSQSGRREQKVEGQYDDQWARRRTPLQPAAGPLARNENRPDKEQERVTEKAASFAESDPRAGLEWAGQLPARGEREAALESLAWACATTDLAVSVEALEQLPAGAGRSRLVAHVVGEWAVNAPNDAQLWAENRPDASERTEALAAFAVAIAEPYPLRAATIVAEKLDSGTAQERAVVAVIQRWVQSDRIAAERWVAQFPNSPLKTAATATIRGTIPPDPPAADPKSSATGRQPR